MLYFFQNNVVFQFFNGMVCCHYHLQWICGYVHVYQIIKQLFHVCSGNSQNYCPSVLGDDLGTIAFGSRPQATVLKSSPAPRVNSFDCSLNRHELTIYCINCREKNHDVVLYFLLINLPIINYHITMNNTGNGSNVA